MSFIELLCNPFFNFVIWFLNMLPTLSMPVDFHTSSVAFGELVSSAGYLLPLPTISAILILYFSFVVMRYMWHMTLFTIQFIPIIRHRKGM